MLKRAVKLLSYSSYSEFVRRTALIEVTKVIKETQAGITAMSVGTSQGSALPLKKVGRLANEYKL